MNTHAALMSKLERKVVSPEIKALCELVDAHRYWLDEDVKRLERKIDRLTARLARSESE